MNSIYACLSTSLLTVDPSEIRASFVARFLRFITDTPYKKCIVFDGGHDWGVGARGPPLTQKIVHQNRDFSPFPIEASSADPWNRFRMVTLHWQSALGFF